MGLGYLKVEVTTGDDALPVENAAIVVKDSFGRVIYRAATNDVGQTNVIGVYAPNKESTLDPNNKEPHYSTYTVEVSVPGKYATEIVHNVQVFDTIESILPVKLLPLPEGTNCDIDVIETPPPAVELPIPRMQEGPSEFQMERAGIGRGEVFIPDYITVHLGPPTVSARNVRVKFTDYIKNVASSEIYPTWPQASLEANIYAIITFALNRVFTEWYRSRGYAFDITNSTSVDQAFTEGRNIFENISRIVDNIFNSFVRRPGRLEPFFTQFCNGTTSTCPGLSQWGTVSLANQGLTPLQILRFYYPRDVEIVTTNNIRGIVDSYPGTPLREGGSGDAVRRMQRYLNRIRVNYPRIPQISNPNGYFGPDTTIAVRTFQQVFNLTTDGVIGNATWNAIIRYYVAVTKLATLESEGERIGIGNTPPNVVLREGSTGADVIELQFLLNYIATFYSEISPVIQDGVFRSTTTTSVKQFQRRFGLVQDGVVGPATWNMLYSVYKGIGNNVTVPTPPAPTPPTRPPYPGYLLRVGSRGESVLLMQRYLNVISRVYTTIPRLTEDGVFGPLTQSAVIAFQRQFGLTPDGIIGPVTWNAIVDQYFRATGS